jgi:hypothetical protein
LGGKYRKILFGLSFDFPKTGLLKADWCKMPLIPGNIPYQKERIIKLFFKDFSPLKSPQKGNFFS